MKGRCSHNCVWHLICDNFFRILSFTYTYTLLLSCIYGLLTPHTHLFFSLFIKRRSFAIIFYLQESQLLGTPDGNVSCCPNQAPLVGVSHGSRPLGWYQKKKKKSVNIGQDDQLKFLKLLIECLFIEWILLIMIWIKHCLFYRHGVSGYFVSVGSLGLN